MRSPILSVIGRRGRASTPPANRIVMLGVAGLSLLASGCASVSPPAPPATVRRPIVGAVQQPLRDLSVLRTPTAEVLEDAARNPYAVPQGGCPALRAETLRLDAELGPDVDAPRLREGRVEGLTTDTLKSAVALPYRGLVRRVSGAAAADERRSAALVAGMVRRGFLKGLMRDCAS